MRLKGELRAMVVEERESFVVVRLVHDAGGGEWQAAVADLRKFLAAESVGTGLARVPLPRLETRKGLNLDEICYHVVDGTTDAVVAILIAAVRSWLRHWRETRGGQRHTVEVVRSEGSESSVTRLGDVSEAGPEETAEGTEGA